MTGEVLVQFSFVRCSLNEVIVFTICSKKRHTLQIPHCDRHSSHFPQNVFSSKKKQEKEKKKLDGNKGPYSSPPVGRHSAELQRRCFHAGTHLNNSRINRREAAGSAATIEKLSDLIRVLHVNG